MPRNPDFPPWGSGIVCGADHFVPFHRSIAGFGFSSAGLATVQQSLTDRQLSEETPNTGAGFAFQTSGRRHCARCTHCARHHSPRSARNEHGETTNCTLPVELIFVLPHISRLAHRRAPTTRDRIAAARRPSVRSYALSVSTAHQRELCSQRRLFTLLGGAPAPRPDGLLHPERDTRTESVRGALDLFDALDLLGGAVGVETLDLR